MASEPEKSSSNAPVVRSGTIAKRRKPKKKRNPMKGLWLRGATYWFAGTVAGHGRIRVSLDTGDPAEALTKAQEARHYPERFLAAHNENSLEIFMRERGKKGLSKAWLDHQRMVLESLAPHAPPKRLEALSRAAAHKWWKDLEARAKAASAAQYMRHIRGFFKWAQDTGRLKGPSPFEDITVPKIRPNPRRSFLTKEQAERVINECGAMARGPVETREAEELKFALFCALHCGLRKGEVIASRPHWFDLKAGLLHVRNESDWLTKDRDNRTIPLTKKFIAFLETYGIRRPYMFRPHIEWTGKNRTGRYRSDFQKLFAGHMSRLGIEGITFHDLRRTFASLHASKGTPLYHIAKWLGDDIAVVESTYAHLTPGNPRINDPWED